MSVLAAWRARNSEVSRSELDQCIIRVLLGPLLALYVASGFGQPLPSPQTHSTVSWYLAAWLVLAVGLLAATWIWPAPSVLRRLLGVISDVGIVTVALHFVGSLGAEIVWVYLFIIFGNGLRYGRGYRYLSQFLSVMGFIIVGLTTPWWWRSQMTVFMGWLMALLTLPFYVAVLSDRTNAARAKAEAALKDCIERQPRASF